MEHHDSDSVTNDFDKSYDESEVPTVIYFSWPATNPGSPALVVGQLERPALRHLQLHVDVQGRRVAAHQDRPLQRKIREQPSAAGT